MVSEGEPTRAFTCGRERKGRPERLRTSYLLVLPSSPRAAARSSPPGSTSGRTSRTRRSCQGKRNGVEPRREAPNLGCSAEEGSFRPSPPTSLPIRLSRLQVTQADPILVPKVKGRIEGRSGPTAPPTAVAAGARRERDADGQRGRGEVLHRRGEASAPKEGGRDGLGPKTSNAKRRSESPRALE